MVGAKSCVCVCRWAVFGTLDTNAYTWLSGVMILLYTFFAAGRQLRMSLRRRVLRLTPFALSSIWVSLSRHMQQPWTRVVVHTREGPPLWTQTPIHGRFVVVARRVSCCLCLKPPLPLFNQTSHGKYSRRSYQLDACSPPCAVVLVNLLIAMFADTYTRIKSRSELEYLYLHSNRIHEHRDVMLRRACSK